MLFSTFIGSMTDDTAGGLILLSRYLRTVYTLPTKIKTFIMHYSLHMSHDLPRIRRLHHCANYSDSIGAKFQYWLVAILFVYSPNSKYYRRCCRRGLRTYR